MHGLFRNGTDFANDGFIFNSISFVTCRVYATTGLFIMKFKLVYGRLI